MENDDSDEILGDPLDDLARSRKAKVGLDASMNAFSRVIAVLGAMLLPAVAGYYADRMFGTSYLVVIGFIAGMLFAVYGMIHVSLQAARDLKDGSVE